MSQSVVSTHSDLEHAIAVLRETGASFVLVRGGEVITRGEGHGVRPLLAELDRLGPARTSGAALADKVVGRAAVMAALWAGIRAFHGEFVSQAAVAELEKRGLPYSYGVLIPQVLNQRGDALCPFEAAVSGIENPEEAMRALRATSERLQAEWLCGTPEPANRAGEERDIVNLHGSLEVSTRPAGPERAGPRSTGKARSLPTRTVAVMGLWLALSVGIPLALHPLGVGPALLPMHIPVLLGGALCGPLAGLIVGGFAPLLSHLLTGMPPMAPPIAALMSFELGTYGLVAGAVRRAVVQVGGRWAALPWLREYVWLVAAMVAGRAVLGAAAALVGPALGLKLSATAYLKAAVLTGVPGVLVQLALIPPLAWRLARARKQA
ncbi:MAG: ECF transporter S component [Bacillota bacterium]